MSDEKQKVELDVEFPAIEAANSFQDLKQQVKTVYDLVTSNVMPRCAINNLETRITKDQMKLLDAIETLNRRVTLVEEQNATLIALLAQYMKTMKPMKSK
jgi:hypothetical protein